MNAAAMASRESTLDFARMGASVRSANMIVAFLNANIQGLDKFIRAHKEDAFGGASGGGKPIWKRAHKGVVMKAIIGVSLPTILLYLMNRNNKQWKSMPRWMKNKAFYIPTPWDDPENPFIAIPKTYMYGMYYANFWEQILEWIDTKAPEALDDLWQEFATSIIPVPTVQWGKVPIRCRPSRPPRRLSSRLPTRVPTSPSIRHRWSTGMWINVRCRIRAN